MTSEQRRVTRTLIRRYLERAEATRNLKHYSQYRPLTHFKMSPDIEWTTDCSGLIIGVYLWADMWTPWLVRDPGGYGYAGVGNTTSLLSTNRTRRVPLDRKFFVGDIALFGPSFSYTKHCTICRRNGYEDDSIWTSHGNEAGPYPTLLQYRGDLLGVFRSQALA